MIPFFLVDIGNKDAFEVDLHPERKAQFSLYMGKMDTTSLYSFSAGCRAWTTAYITEEYFEALRDMFDSIYTIMTHEEWENRP